MSDKIKTTLCIVLGIISLSGAVWGANEYLENYVERVELYAFRNQYRIDKIQYRMQWLEERMFSMTRKYGPNCQSAQPMERQIYNDYMREYQQLQRKLQRLMRGG